MKQKIFFCLIISLTIATGYLYGGSNSNIQNDIAGKLISEGFENVRVIADESRLLVSYENRIFRFDVDAVKNVIGLTAPLLNDNQKIMLVPLNRKIPIIVLEMNVPDCKNYLSGSITGEEFSERMKIVFNTDAINKELAKHEIENSSSYKLDVVVKPSLNMQFGPFTQPVLYQVNIIPDFKTSLWEGMSLNYEMIVPIKNEFGSRQDSVRPGIVALNQTLRLPDDIFVSTSAGVFTQERYGWDVEARKYFANGNMSLGFNYGLTSYISYSGLRKFFYSKAFTWTGNISFEYRLPDYDLTLGVSGGRYLYGDNTVRFDINREFGEVEIGFFALKSDKGVTNGGIKFSIPLLPSRNMKPGLARISIADQFERSYLVRSNIDDLIGLRYNTGNRLENFTKKLNPLFVKRIFRYRL